MDVEDLKKRDRNFQLSGKKYSIGNIIRIPAVRFFFFNFRWIPISLFLGLEVPCGKSWIFLQFLRGLSGFLVRAQRSRKRLVKYSNLCVHLIPNKLILHVIGIKLALQVT